MSSERSSGQRPFFSSRFLQIVWVICFLSLLIVIATLFRINSNVEDIEKKLSYSPPTQAQRASSPALELTGKKEYVPVYSHVYTQGGRPVLLEITLSIRNTDIENQMFVNEVVYYDSMGKLIKKFIETPLLVDPLATVEFLVEQKEYEGGSGANFIVQWVSEQSVNPPLIEAVMVGSIEGESISFVRQAVPIE